MRAMSGALHEYGDARFLEDVHAVVAGHGIGAKADVHAGAEKFRKGRNAVSELRVRDRTVRDTAPRPCDGGDIARVDAHTVNQERTRMQYVERGEECNW